MGQLAIAGILAEVNAERERQKTLVFDGVPCEELDKKNTKSDWSCYILDYLGRSTNGYRNENEDFRRNMVKIAALAVAAIEAHDAGHC